ncbi:MAG: MlaE family ABC transporter permease [Candidatus Brocadiia bacterium]
MPQSLIESLGARLFGACEEAGNMVVLFVESLRECSRVAEHPHRIFVQMKNIGNDTLFIASAISLFIGMTLALYSGHALRQFSYTEALPSLVANSIVKEMAPVITALLLAGRIGAAIAAELGTMRVNEEIDALYTLGISPIRYLAMPRFVGCITMLPILVIYASLVGMFGGALIASAYFNMTWGAYFKAAFKSLDMSDVGEGLVKALLFGAIVATVSIHRGLSTRGGAEGVGRAITRCVVTSFIWIIICDYFVTRFMM